MTLFDDPSCQAVKGHDMAGRAQLNGSPRHSINNATVFILRKGHCAYIPHFQQASRTVAAHAGQDHANGSTAHHPRDGCEQHIDARFVAANRVGVAQSTIGPLRRMDCQMAAPRRHIDMPHFQRLVMVGQKDVGRAMRIQPCRQRTGKACPDMLDNQCWRTIGRPSFQQLDQRFDAAGR